jgi:hypothetical protein
MGLNKEWTEWHLTPRGWERGTDSVDGIRNEVSRPVDAVITYQYREVRSAADAPLETHHGPVWRSSDDAAIAALLEKFGDAPKKL